MKLATYLSILIFVSTYGQKNNSTVKSYVNMEVFVGYSKEEFSILKHDEKLITYINSNPNSLKGKIIAIKTNMSFEEELDPTLTNLWDLFKKYQSKLEAFWEQVLKLFSKVFNNNISQ